MSETRKRIKEYKAALPGLRERVIATALLFALSAAIMTVSSFAWFTLSKAPEVAGVATQIAANGNLEIALSGPDGVTPPNESAIGDSSASEGQTILRSNLTWGNLLNLSDPDYGLEKVILRPAVLNNNKLGTEPLRSVIYGADGRVSHDQNSKFSYCTWEPANDEIATPHFGVTGKYGVRAIATVTERFESELGGTTEDMVKYYGYLGAAEIENSKVDTIYQNELIADNNSLSALATIMGYYMQARINSQYDDLNNPECTDQIASVNKLYSTFLKAMEQELNAMVALANVQQFVFTKSESYTPYTAQTLLAATAADLSAKGISLKNFASFVADYNSVKTDAATIAGMAADAADIGTQIYLNDIKPIIDRLVTVNSCIVRADSTTTTIGAIGGVSAALDIAGAKDVDVEIQEGILARFEQRAGTYVYRDNMSVSVTVRREIISGIPTTVPASVEADITTKFFQKPPSLFAEDVAWTQDAFERSGLANGKKILTAGDTYGLAVDFWVRTNAGDAENGISYLVLEGKVLYEQNSGTDADGNAVGLLFYYTVTDENTGNKTDYYVYQTEDGKWYEDYAHHESNNELTAATLAGKQLKEAYKDAPVGYEGENRVWEEIQQETLQPPLSEFNTTQGGGSCYTFYADSPQDQQMILNLLRHMYVVFTDGGDGYLSMARFDTEENHYYAVGGKVTVPLVIMQSNYSFLNELGESVDAVAELRQDVAKRITALVYLDGKELSNKEALAASDVQGTLNLQFGSSIALTTLGDSVLQEQERAVSATVETANANNVLDFFSDDLTAKVTVTVTGDQPANVKAFFQREINAFQGSRQETMTFTQVGERWVCEDFQFPAPGKYVLRSVILDGVEYDLHNTPEVTVNGVFLKSLEVKRGGQILSTRNNTIMTADADVSLNLTAEFATDSVQKQPKKMSVELVRTEDGSSISVDMTAATSGWTGTAKITTSGYYEMAYVVMDGERYDLDSFGKTFDMYLGLSAIVEAMPGTPQVMLLENEEGVTLGIRAKIVDNGGNGLRGFPDFPLVYRGESTGETLEAVVRWNAVTGYYEGNFHLTQPDAYRFSYLESQGNYISSYKSAVVFRASSNKPASYVGCDNNGNTIFVLPGENVVAEMLVRMANTGGAQINAYFVNEKGTTYVVREDAITSSKVVDGVTTWKIPVPAVDGSQAGRWTLKKLALSNVVDSDGRSYTLQNPLTWNLAEQTGGEPYITVVSEIEMSLGNIANNAFYGEFMDSYQVSDLSVNLFYRDSANQAVAMPEELTVSDVTLHYVHQNDSMALGYYSYNATVPSIDVAMTDSGDGMHFTQSSAITLQVAGTYKLKNVTYKINGKEYSKEISTGVAAKITVGSAKPTVIVTGASPNKSHTTINSSDKDQTVTSGFTTYEATVHMEASKSGNGKITTCPSVTLTVSAMGSASGATMKFTNSSGSTSTMYTGSEKSGSCDGFSWSADGNCTRFVGEYKSSNTCSSMTRNAAGTITSSTLVLTYGGVDYSFTVPTITIKNPF